MRPSPPASAASSASRTASAVVRAATPATSGARPASASRQRRRTAFFSSNESEPPSPREPRATTPVQPARTSASTCLTSRSASTERSGLNGVVIAGITPCHFMAGRIASRVPLRLAAIALLLVGSGASALAYQLVWTRELRLVFGHSTAASAAVLAIFIGGLGAGSLLIGPRADRHPRPLALYARLEAAVALFAALTPLLLAVARAGYLALGGSLALGSVLSTLVRLLLSALVLLVPTLLMGGTLPAAAREVEGTGDARRRTTALLYGANTMGAVAGALVATFYAFERLGNRGTLFAACAVNLGVALAAALLARGKAPALSPAPEPPAAAGRPAPRGFVLAACAIVGFAFFLLELVWYRMLSPLLGGSVFTFGLILATALLGIAAGGLAYALVGRDQDATLLAFSVTCLLEAAAVAAGFALGDRLALLAIVLRPLGNLAFAGHVLGWSAVAALVVLPPAFVAGAQFPLLIALLGRGREHVGRDIGRATACNTGGAVLGALAGGFGLLPLLTAPGCWRLVAALLLALGPRGGRARPAARPHAPARPGRDRRSWPWPCWPRPGPTAAFRHSGIGAGRVTLSRPRQPERDGGLAARAAALGDLGGGGPGDERRPPRPDRPRLRGERQGGRPLALRRGDAGHVGAAGRAPPPGSPARPGRGPRHRLHRRLARRRAGRRARGRRGARARDGGGGAAVRPGEPQRPREPAAPPLLRRRARAPPHDARALRPRRLRALEPLSRGDRQPLQPRVLPRGGRAPRGGRPLPAVGPGLRGAPRLHPQPLRDARRGAPGGRDVADPAGRPHARERARAAAPRPRPDRRPHPRGAVPRGPAGRVAHRSPRGPLRPLRRGARLRGAAPGALASPQHRRPERPRVRLRAQPGGGRPPRRRGRAAGRGRGGRRPPRVLRRDARPRAPAGRAARRLLERGRGPAPPEGRTGPRPAGRRPRALDAALAGQRRSRPGAGRTRSRRGRTSWPSWPR